MKLKSYKILVLLFVVCFSTGFKNTHPVKLTAALVEYNPKTKGLRMECRVFIDDFTYSINRTLTKDINISALTEEDKKGIEDYFKKYYTLTVNNKELPLKYKASKVMTEYNVFAIQFFEDVIPIKKGDVISINNALFFEEFDFLQSNRITVRIPPLISEEYYETTSDNNPITLNL